MLVFRSWRVFVFGLVFGFAVPIPQRQAGNFRIFAGFGDGGAVCVADLEDAGEGGGGLLFDGGRVHRVNCAKNSIQPQRRNP